MQLRLILGWMCALAGGAMLCASDDLSDDAALLAELESTSADEDFALPAWDFGGDVSLGGGYRSNVLLAAFEQDGSAFVRTSLDVLAWRYPTEDGVEWINFFNLTAARYFSAATDDSVLAILRSERRWRSGDRWRFALAGQFVHQEEVIDASTLDSGFTSVEARLNSYAIEPSAEWKLTDDWAWIMDVVARYDDFGPPLDDHFEYGAESGLRRGLGRYGDLRLTYGYRWRNYRDRMQAAIGGRPLDGTQLGVGQRKVEARYDLRGGKNWKWDFDLRASYMENEDNGSGWYDYDRRVVASSWSVRGSSWLIEADASWRRYDYRVQTVGFGDPPKRKRTSWTGYVRVEKDLADFLVLFSEVELEHSVSNDPFLDYDDAIVLLGLRWSR